MELAPEERIKITTQGTSHHPSPQVEPLKMKSIISGATSIKKSLKNAAESDDEDYSEDE